MSVQHMYCTTSANAAASDATRDSLIRTHMAQVQLLATRLHSSLNGSVDLEDLISAGTIGLITAVDNFDASLGHKLKTYAEHRIRGAMLDSISKLDGRGREERRMARAIEAAALAAERRLGRTAAQEDIADQLEISVEELHRRLQWSASITLLSYHASSTDTSSDANDYTGPLDTPAPDASPEREAERAELWAMINGAMENIDSKECEVLLRFYGDGLTLSEIATVMGEPEWRVLKLKKRALENVRMLLSYGCAAEFTNGVEPPAKAALVSLVSVAACGE